RSERWHRPPLVPFGPQLVQVAGRVVDAELLAQRRQSVHRILLARQYHPAVAGGLNPQLVTRLDARSLCCRVRARCLVLGCDSGETPPPLPYSGSHGVSIVTTTTMGTLYAGTSGFSYPSWRGTFYPDKLPASRMLN